MTLKGKHPALIVAGHMLRSFRYPLIIYAIVFTAVIWGLEMLRVRGIVPMDGISNGEIWEGAAGSPKIFALVIGILLIPVSLASFVTNGLTRRDFFKGVVVFMLITSLLCVVIIQAGFATGHAVMSAVDGTWDVGSNPFSGKAVLGNYLLVLTYFGAGMLIGIVFYRFNWRLAIPLAVLAYVPTMLTELVFAFDDPGDGLVQGLGAFRMSFSVQTILALLVLGLVIALNYSVIRRVPIKRKLV